jgi:phospholipase C
MQGNEKWKPYARKVCLAAAVALAVGTGTARANDDHGKDDDASRGSTATPIKHVIIIVGENRSFDHLFATYVPRHGAKVANLLSQGIVRADGSPGPNFAKGHQFQVVSPPNGGKFFISASMKRKQLYATLPAPDIGGVGAVSPYAAILTIPGGDPGLPPQSHMWSSASSPVTLALDSDPMFFHQRQVPSPNSLAMSGTAASRPRFA